MFVSHFCFMRNLLFSRLGPGVFILIMTFFCFKMNSFPGRRRKIGAFHLFGRFFLSEDEMTIFPLSPSPGFSS